MALPKNFNKTVNFNNRIESLNDLVFYIVEYDFVLTNKKVEDFNIDNEITGIKEVYALNEEQAKAKVENWFNVLTQNGILESYKIKSAEFKDINQIIEKKIPNNPL